MNQWVWRGATGSGLGWRGLVGARGTGWGLGDREQGRGLPGCVGVGCARGTGWGLGEWRLVGRWAQPRDCGGGGWSMLWTRVRGWLCGWGVVSVPGTGSGPGWRGLVGSPADRLAQGPGPFSSQREERTGAEEHLSWRIAMGDGKIWILYKKKKNPQPCLW